MASFTVMLISLYDPPDYEYAAIRLPRNSAGHIVYISTKLGDVLRNRDTHRLYLEFVPTC